MYFTKKQLQMWRDQTERIKKFKKERGKLPFFEMVCNRKRINKVFEKFYEFTNSCNPK